MDKNISCGECIFFEFFYDHDDPIQRRLASIDDLLSVTGECRKNTPIIFHDNSSRDDDENISEYTYRHTAWPAVDHLDWCGEFKRKGV